MKKNILLLAFCIYSIASYSVSWTISSTITQMTFNPSTLNINNGDTIIFSLAGSHNAVEVSQATWNANMGTPLTGGFSVPFGGGTLLTSQLSPGVHYYVCQNHVAGGMKGTITVCAATLSLKFFIQGYYVRGGSMQQVLYNELVDPNVSSTNVDTVVVELHPSSNTASVAATFKGVVQTNGTLSAAFACSIVGSSYYIVIRHRNTIATWSASAVAFPTQTTAYDFTTARAKAYANNMIDVFTEGVWAFYNGDINQDTNVDLLDFPSLDSGIVSGFFGYYTTDLNGDGNVDLLDFPLLDHNINAGIFSQHP